MWAPPSSGMLHITCGKGRKDWFSHYRLGGDDQHREIAVRFDVLEPLRRLTSVHAGHLQIEQNRVATVLEVKLADLVRVHRGRDRNIAGTAQHPLQQDDIAFPIVHDQDFSCRMSDKPIIRIAAL